MLNNLKARRDREEGFTLIELMVVVLIIAILIAIAIPTFLGARERAQDRASQSSLRNALTAAKTAYTDASDYSASTDADLACDRAEPDVRSCRCRHRPARRTSASRLRAWPAPTADLGGRGLVEVG